MCAQGLRWHAQALTQSEAGVETAPSTGAGAGLGGLWHVLGTDGRHEEFLWLQEGPEEVIGGAAGVDEPEYTIEGAVDGSSLRFVQRYHQLDDRYAGRLATAPAR